MRGENGMTEKREEERERKGKVRGKVQTFTGQKRVEEKRTTAKGKRSKTGNLGNEGEK